MSVKATLSITAVLLHKCPQLWYVSVCLYGPRDMLSQFLINWPFFSIVTSVPRSELLDIAVTVLCIENCKISHLSFLSVLRCCCLGNRKGSSRCSRGWLSKIKNISLITSLSLPPLRKRRRYCDVWHHIVCLCVRRATTACRVSLGSEGNVLYPVLSSWNYWTSRYTDQMLYSTDLQ